MEKAITKEILKKVRRIEVRTRRMVDNSLAGSYHSVFKGQGMNFDEVREYVPGDEIRSIDWNVTARTGVPHVKKFTEERELTITLMIDISGSGDFGSADRSKREMMAELGSIIALWSANGTWHSSAASLSRSNAPQPPSWFCIRPIHRQPRSRAAAIRVATRFGKSI